MNWPDFPAGVVVIDHRRPFHISASGNVLPSGSVVKPTAVQKLRDVQDTPQNWASGALGVRPRAGRVWLAGAGGWVR